MKTPQFPWLSLTVLVAILAIACPLVIMPYLSRMSSSDSTTRQVAADLLSEVKANAAATGIGVSDKLNVTAGAKPSGSLRIDGLEFKRFIGPDGRVFYAGPPGVGYLTDENGVPVRVSRPNETGVQ